MTTKLQKVVKVVKRIDSNLVVLFVSCPVTGKSREVWGADEVVKPLNYYISKGFLIIK